MNERCVTLPCDKSKSLCISHQEPTWLMRKKNHNNTYSQKIWIPPLHPPIHTHFRVRCCPCAILWCWQHQAMSCDSTPARPQLLTSIFTYSEHVFRCLPSTGNRKVCDGFNTGRGPLDKGMSKYQTFHSRKCISKCRLWNGGYFVQCGGGGVLKLVGCLLYDGGTAKMKKKHFPHFADIFAIVDCAVEHWYAKMQQ